MQAYKKALKTGTEVLFIFLSSGVKDNTGGLKFTHVSRQNDMLQNAHK